MLSTFPKHTFFSSTAFNKTPDRTFATHTYAPVWDNFPFIESDGFLGLDNVLHIKSWVNLLAVPVENYVFCNDCE